jgi:multiple sugar transport system ATP-binding protein
MAEVIFEHVTKSYTERTPIIQDLNLEIRDHEFLVLVGPSGCGKSTALRMIAGLEEVTEGNLYIGERLVNEVAPKDRDIAMVFQNYALYPHMSVYDNMAFALKLRDLPRAEIEERVNKASDMLGIREYLERRPRALSGGQRQRVALGRALVRAPQVFLLDEPLSNLDAKLRAQTRTEISRLHQATQTTFVYVTHDQVEAMTMGDRVAVLNAGVIQQLGTPQELYDAPSNLFVAGFIGAPAMNFFTGRLTRAEGGPAVVIGEGAGATTLTPAGPAADVVARHASADGRASLVGIRPEDLRLAQGERHDMLAGVAEIVEHLGSEQLLYLRVAGQAAPDGAELQSTVARLPATASVRVGERVELAVDTARLHLFDPASGARLA